MAIAEDGASSGKWRLPVSPAGRVSERLESAFFAVILAIGTPGLLGIAFDLLGLLAAGKSHTRIAP